MNVFQDDYPVAIKDFTEMFNLSNKTPYELIKRHKDIFKTCKLGKTTYISAESVLKYRKNRKKNQESLNNTIFSFYMRKGGVGKTTLLLNTAVRACMYGFKVLIIDLDSQANITRSFKVMSPKDRDTFLNIFNKEINPSDAIIKVRKNLHLIPANNKLTKLSTEIDSMRGFQQFKPFLDELKKEYDMIFMDCGGLMDMAVFQAMAVSEMIISPTFPDDYSDEGLELTFEEVEKLKFQGFSPSHKIVINRYDPNYKEKATKLYVPLFEDLYSDNICSVKIRKSQDIINATSDGCSVFESSQKSKVIEDLDKLFLEISGIKDNKENQH